MTRPVVLPAPASEPKPQVSVGSQVVLDLYECATDHLDDVAWVKATLVSAARAAGATIVQTVFHQFAPWGISGVVVIAESHLAIHIWPENRYAAIDVFTCGENVRMDVACAFLIGAFRSQRPVERRFTRGEHIVADSGHCAAVGSAGARQAAASAQRRARKLAASSAA
jgi:S-adenosylmethionine decarboxylase